MGGRLASLDAGAKMSEVWTGTDRTGRGGQRMEAALLVALNTQNCTGEK